MQTWISICTPKCPNYSFFGKGPGSELWPLWLGNDLSDLVVHPIGRKPIA